MTAWELQDTLLKRQTDKIPGLNMMIPTAMHCQKIFANCFKHPVVHNSNSYNFWIISFMRTKSLFTSKLMTNFWAAKDGISVLLITKPRPHKCLAACCPACLLWKHILVQNSFQRISTPTTLAETVEKFSIQNQFSSKIQVNLEFLSTLDLFISLVKIFWDVILGWY